MKKLLLLVFLTANVFLSQAQNFFYVETGTGAENMIKEKLTRSSQFVTASLIESEYIIKPEINQQAKNNMQTIRITVVDTMTLKTIYQSEEGYSASFINLSPKILSKFAIQTFIEKNIPGIILFTRHDSFHKMIRCTGLKKDKT